MTSEEDNHVRSLLRGLHGFEVYEDEDECFDAELHSHDEENAPKGTRAAPYASRAEPPTKRAKTPATTLS